MKVAGARQQSCEPPPPGALRRPPHPLLGILFVYAVAAGIVWGALGGGGDPLPRLGIAACGLIVFLAVAVHWIEGVELAHVPAKLGLSRAGKRWWLVGAGAALPAWIVVLQRLLPGGETLTPRVALVTAVVLGEMLFQEGFYRGFVFRGLMRRHGFSSAAGASAILAALLIVLAGLAGHPLYADHPWPSALGELPLAVALCQLFWLSGQKLAPALLVRGSLLGAAWLAGPVWLPLAAAVFLLALCRAAVR